MKPEEPDRFTIIKYRIQRAEETLQDAKVAAENNRLFNAANRIYYSLFYSVSALLLTKGLSFSKHSAVKSAFHKEFIKAGTVAKKYGDFYDKMLANREEGDYGTFAPDFSKDQIINWISQTNEFISVIKELTLRIINENK